MSNESRPCRLHTLFSESYGVTKVFGSLSHLDRLNLVDQSANLVHFVDSQGYGGRRGYDRWTHYRNMSPLLTEGRLLVTELIESFLEIGSRHGVFADKRGVDRFLGRRFTEAVHAYRLGFESMRGLMKQLRQGNPFDQRRQPYAVLPGRQFRTHGAAGGPPSTRYPSLRTRPQGR